MPRLFIAIDLPEQVKINLSTLCQGANSVHWVARQNLHLTLLFLGEVMMEQYHQLVNGLKEVPFYPFELRLADLGYFGKEKSPRVLWAGLDAPPELNELERRITQKVEEMRLPLDEKKFKAHITLGRLSHNGPKHSYQDVGIHHFLQQNLYLNHQTFEVTGFQLFSSKLTPRGAIYTIEQFFPGEIVL